MKQTARKRKSPPAPLLEVEDLRIRLEEAEETLRAIRRGEIDGLIVEGAQGKQVYTLKGADESYRTLVEAMTEGALIIGRDGIILYANKRFADIVGTPLPKVIGSFSEVYVPPQFRSAVSEVTSKGLVGSIQAEILLNRPDGTAVPVQLSAGAIRLDGVACVGVLVTDLTEQKERETSRVSERRVAEDEIRRHVANLETTNRELEAFVYSVSHDLRAPLRSIHRFSTLIQEDYGGVLDGTGKEYLGRITSAAVRMDDLIRDLLTYSRVSMQDIALRPVDTASIIAEVVRQQDEEIRESGAEVILEKPFPAAMGDVLLLSQVLTNLLSNALKFVTAGRRARVVIRGKSLGPVVRLWVEDNGIGMAPEEQGRVFRLFERLHQEFPGTGVGLAIVQRAIERMGGRVGVESRAGEGSRFWVELRSLDGEGS